MARIRSVHPGFFTDERCVLASAFARLLFIGLWGQADDNGVFEWKPTTLKMRVLPADDVVIVALLEELTAAECIQKITVGGKEYGLIRNFLKYQRPKKPTAIYPLPDEYRTYVDPRARKAEPVPHQFPTAPEIVEQREDGGGEKEEIVIPLTPLQTDRTDLGVSTAPQGVSSLHSTGGVSFLDLIGLWPRKDALPDDVRREWYAAEEQGATGESIMAAARKYLALPEVVKTAPNYLKKLDAWMIGGGWKNIGAVIEANVQQAIADRDRAWQAKFVAEGKRYPASMFPKSVKDDLGAQFNGTQQFGPAELIAEYERLGVDVPPWLDPLRLPNGLRRTA